MVAKSWFWGVEGASVSGAAVHRSAVVSQAAQLNLAFEPPSDVPQVRRREKEDVERDLYFISTLLVVRVRQLARLVRPLELGLDVQLDLGVPLVLDLNRRIVGDLAASAGKPVLEARAPKLRPSGGRRAVSASNNRRGIRA